MIVWFVCSVLVIIASPSYPHRATFASSVLLLILIIHKLKQWEETNERTAHIVHIICAACAVGFLFVLFSIDLLSFVRLLNVYIPH